VLLLCCVSVGPNIWPGEEQISSGKATEKNNKA